MPAPAGSPVIPVVQSQPPGSTPAPAFPDLVPVAPTGVTSEGLEQIRQQMLANLPGLSAALDAPVIEEGYDPSMMRQLHQIGLSEDPVLRRAFRMEENPEAMVKSIGEQTTHVQVDNARNQVLAARLALYKTLDEFSAFRMESELKRLASIEGLIQSATPDPTTTPPPANGPVNQQQPVVADPAAPVAEEEVKVEIPDPQVLAVYQYESEYLARILWMNRTWTVREGDTLPDGSKVKSIDATSIEIRPKDEKKSKTLLLIAG